MIEKLYSILGPLAKEYNTKSKKASNVMVQALIESNLLILKELTEIKEILNKDDSEGTKEEEKESKLKRLKKE